MALSFVGLIVSGTAILIAHPRFYWGETGTFSMPSLLDLPLDPVYEHTGWGRHLHFLSAWVFVASGLVYVVSGLLSRHFQSRLLPARSELNQRALAEVFLAYFRRRRHVGADVWRYNVVQRLAYLLVIFVLCPAMIWTGLAMSPAVSSEYPLLVTVLGGHQSARTLHFVVANLLALFLVVHLTMLVLVGFGTHVLAMVTGYGQSSGSRA